MSLTAEQTTAQNFKDFYDRIRPLLNAQHYHVDRSGQELKSGQYALAESVAIGTGTNITVAVGAAIPFVKQSGDFVDGPTTGSFIVPAGMRIEVTLFGTVTDGANNNSGVYLYNETDGVYLDSANSKQMPGAYFYGGQASLYGMSQSCVVQWTNNTGKDIAVSMRNAANGTVLSLRVHATGMTVKEIGRIVDPIQYMSSGDNLEETPVGNIITYMGNNVPKHYLTCDGTTYSIGSYPELEAHFIAEFGSVNYFGGDGTSTFAVPDLRGEFLRGTGTNSHTNQGSGANVGAHQDGTLHSLSSSSAYIYGANSISDSLKEDSTGTIGRNRRYVSGSIDSNPMNVYTSRPTNTSVKFCIKYESTYHVIVPSHMYKVNATFDLVWNSTDQAYILNTLTYKSGDQSLIDGNLFKAPLTGWYNISFNSGQVAKTTKIMQYLHIVHNGTATIYTDGSNSDTNTGWWGLDINRIFYLEKDDTVYARIWTEGQTITLPSNMNASFCLLTANYKDNIIAGGEVYSEEEQVIGTWTDGKPLYQKTIITTLPSAIGTDKFADIGTTVDTIVDIKAQALRNNNYSYSVNGCCVLGDFTSAVMVNASNNNASSNKNKIGFVINKEQFIGQPITVTVQYTKTTDQANTYQYKNSLLLTRPDMWEAGVEYDFGGGLYGQRFIGTHSTAGGSAKQLLVSVTKIVDQGGQIKCPSWVTAPCPFGWGSDFYGMAFIDGSNKLMFNIKTQTTETATYDIWVTYKK